MKLNDLFSLRFLAVSLLLALVSSPSFGAEAIDPPDTTGVFDHWFGSDAQRLSETEFDSLVCMASAVGIGFIITVVGGVAIVYGDDVGSAAGTAIALPVLVSSMWAACAIGRAVAPGAVWLKRRSKVLVKNLSITGR